MDHPPRHLGSYPKRGVAIWTGGSSALPDVGREGAETRRQVGGHHGNSDSNGIDDLRKGDVPNGPSQLGRKETAPVASHGDGSLSMKSTFGEKGVRRSRCDLRALPHASTATHSGPHRVARDISQSRRTLQVLSTPGALRRRGETTVPVEVAFLSLMDMGSERAVSWRRHVLDGDRA
jgi:hypothetical protein